MKYWIYHLWPIGHSSATRDKFNISLVITITIRDIFQYKIPAIVYSPNKLLKQLITSVTEPFAVNKRIIAGKFPEPIKISKITPIWKKGEHIDPSNYRPICQLCSFSKLYEKIYAQPMNKFSIQNNNSNIVSNKDISQGSTLGPMIHSLYWAEITNVTSLFTILFADDCNLIISGPNLHNHFYLAHPALGAHI